MKKSSAKSNIYSGKPSASFKFQHIIYEKNSYKAKITINREKSLNCLNLTTITELSTAFKDASWDDDIAVIILTGAGKRAFSTGADLDEQQEYFLNNPKDYYKWMNEFIHLHETMRNCGKPTIARLNGIVVGGGNELNISCDLAIAADHIYIRQVGAAREVLQRRELHNFCRLWLVIEEREKFCSCAKKFLRRRHLNGD